MEIHTSLLFSIAYILLNPLKYIIQYYLWAKLPCFQSWSHHRHKTSLSTLLGSSCLDHLSLTVGQACQATRLKDPCPIIGTLKGTTGHILGWWNIHFTPGCEITINEYFAIENEQELIGGRVFHFSILASSILILSLNQSLNSIEQHHILRKMDSCSVYYVKSTIWFIVNCPSCKCIWATSDIFSRVVSTLPADLEDADLHSLI